MLRALLFSLSLLAAGNAAAVGFPAPYKPMVIEAKGTPERYEFDLTAALARARQEKKRLYVYLHADNCPFCRKYELFLGKNAEELAPHFAKDYIVVDLKSTLKTKQDTVQIRIGEKLLNYTEFQKSIGDERARLLVYPNIWLLDADGKPLMQMPAGSGTFETVPEQLEILRLEQ